MDIEEEIGDELEHRQAPVTYEGEVFFTVDEKLQSLIQFFVDKGIETFNSCEDNINGNAWIEFELEDWKFINEIAFLSESRELMEFIQAECEVLLLSTDDGHPDENDEYWIEGENLIWSASVRFSEGHLEDFEQMVRFTLDHVGEEGADSIQ
jgi:hypothetical protein